MLTWWFMESYRTAIDWLSVHIERNENEIIGTLIQFIFDKGNRILSVSSQFRLIIKIRKNGRIMNCFEIELILSERRMSKSKIEISFKLVECETGKSNGKFSISFWDVFNLNEIQRDCTSKLQTKKCSLLVQTWYYHHRMSNTLNSQFEIPKIFFCATNDDNKIKRLQC